ncbi:sensory transduction protein kinase [Plesiocystis pacifica SIR-1]|uniref:histidine kinase n=1 Tax=Plesiocystis pacifica SIR-1 TaxID=391625 RepID=A6FYP2_9BACT|nr:ATP-binding protein [Plesiocystis pacifica]EDM81314.1 sensory transduction protein kinase [Plesiocystis pacifica SIR-1]
MGLSALLEPPTFADPSQSRRGKLLYRVLSFTSPLLVVLSAVTTLNGEVELGALYGAQLVVVIIVLALLRRDGFKPAVGLFLLSIWLSSSLNVLSSGGLGSSATGSFVIIVLCAGFFWDVRAALVFVVLSGMAAGAMLVWADALGLASPPGSSMGRYFGELMAQLFTAALILHFALRFIAEAARKEHQAQAELLVRAAQRERDVEKLEALGRLSAGVAHDFNNLLMAISSTIDLLEIEGRGATAEDFGNLRETVDRATRLSAELLCVGRDTARPLSELELDAFVGSVEALLFSLAGEGVELRVELEAPGRRILADPGELERVLTNLVVNARDAMAGRGRMVVSTSLAEPYVCLSVVDSGPGMSEEVIAQAFEPFFTTKGERGTGLGLATCQSIVRRYGGSIELDARLGEGTQVRLLLPLCGAG